MTNPFEQLKTAEDFNNFLLALIGVYIVHI